MRPCYVGWFENIKNYGIVRCDKEVVDHLLAANAPSGSWFTVNTSFTVIRYALLEKLMSEKKKFDNAVVHIRGLRVVTCKTFKLEKPIEKTT